eukprot:TRINITY_DN34544_c0_g1_i1.p1 TRINITY_DN34544_c0_g1~~TRINITY_DN34544_c0_g1_i1.p1  ORF type:complete len:287 (+),score=49.05 TRINITY_DN34544_c0_g1_i1:2-862(+)
MLQAVPALSFPFPGAGQPARLPPKQASYVKPCRQLPTQLAKTNFRSALMQSPVRSASVRLRPRRNSFVASTPTVLSEVFERLTMVDPMPLLESGPAPAWSDALLMTCALAMCGTSEAVLGREVAGWAAVSAVVVTGLETDLQGQAARSKCYMRLAGTLVGATMAFVVGNSWTCMAAWASTLTMVKRRLKPRWGYACNVAALTYAVVGLAGSTGGQLVSRGSNRFLGVLLGCAAVTLCLEMRALGFMAWNYTRRRLQMHNIDSVRKKLNRLVLKLSQPDNAVTLRAH